MPERRQIPLGFEQALQESEELLLALERAGKPDLNQIAALEAMFENTASCRGFFITLLTGESPLADNLPDYLIQAMRGRDEVVPELLAKNIVMSAATNCMHKRNGETENAQGSAQVLKRTGDIVKRMQSEAVHNQLKAMQVSIKTKTGIYAEFLQRWDYDEEQLSEALQAIEQCFCP